MGAHYTSGATAVNAILDIIPSSTQALTRMVLCYHGRLALAWRDRIGRGDVRHGFFLPLAAQRHFTGREPLAELEETRLGRQIAASGLAQKIDVEVDGHRKRNWGRSQRAPRHTGRHRPEPSWWDRRSCRPAATKPRGRLGGPGSRRPTPLRSTGRSR